MDWTAIENDIFAAFNTVKLEDGIGYYEAGAIDDYLSPDSPEYFYEKLKTNAMTGGSCWLNCKMIR